MKLYSFENKQLEEVNVVDNMVNIYTCGPTVYDFPHIGNWYTFIRYDSLIRALRFTGVSVNWVMNITDVGHLVSDADEGEDKLEKGAKREGKTAWDVAGYYSEYFINGLKRLNFSEVNHLPRATDYISEQIELVKQLESNNFTYQIDDGIYFDTSKFNDYANFAHLELNSQHEGARVEVNTQKRNASDFAVWKFSPKNEKRDMEWQSPWGIGFPGWHLECSAMIHALLSEPLSIHGGGIDHIPVHHTNEIAQSEAAFGKKLSNHWYHCNHILVNGKKMSKSLGNFYTLEDIEKQGFSPMIFRMHVLSGHYRSQSEFSFDGLLATSQRLQGWVDTLTETKFSRQTSRNKTLKEIKTSLIEIISDDMNTPRALSYIDEIINQVDTAMVDDFVDMIDSLLGSAFSDLLAPLNDEQNALLSRRNEMRANKDWEESDRLRDELHSLGITLRDSATITYWSRTV